ncbi:hypothetical protein HFO68_32970 [Rhizobium laguerreae]|uniref:hypothetical protein n=1 Tax=Rhizobium laguerreae TaxID=1076926 RepID=UPI001C9000C1|nr:hypothetical protein [Rhizobium laguerreae]MBY3109304.1 hypothetical protein [Rhizobium laguerreae]
MNRPSELLFSSAHVDITPSTPIPLAGYMHRTSPFTSSSGRLEINGVRFASHELEVIILSLDALFCGDLEGEIAARVTGTPRLLLLASHTHYAPSLDRKRQNLGIFTAGYIDEVVTAAVRLIETLRKEASAIKSVGTATSENAATFAISRRGPRFRIARRWPFIRREMCLAPALKRPIDTRLSALAITTEDNDTPAILWNWACHPVSAADPLSLSSAFPGAAREGLRETLGQKASVVFCQGFAGDIRPRFLGRIPKPMDLVTGFPGPYFREPDQNTYDRFLSGVTSVLTNSLKALRFGEAITRLSYTRTKLALSSIAGDGAEGDLTFDHLQIAGALNLVCISAEPFNSYGQLIREIFGDDAWAVGYSGDVFGYLPDNRAIGEGGYEVVGFAPIFGFSGQFLPDTEDRIGTALRALKEAKPYSS